MGQKGQARARPGRGSTADCSSRWPVFGLWAFVAHAWLSTHHDCGLLDAVCQGLCRRCMAVMCTQGGWTAAACGCRRSNGQISWMVMTKHHDLHHLPCNVCFSPTGKESGLCARGSGFDSRAVLTSFFALFVLCLLLSVFPPTRSTSLAQRTCVAAQCDTAVCECAAAQQSVCKRSKYSKTLGPVGIEPMTSQSGRGSLRNG